MTRLFDDSEEKVVVFEDFNILENVEPTQEEIEKIKEQKLSLTD